MSHGVVPAASSVRGPLGYFSRGLFGTTEDSTTADAVTSAEEQQSLLQVGAAGQPTNRCQLLHQQFSIRSICISAMPYGHATIM
jgi:hypothetical protein